MSAGTVPSSIHSQIPNRAFQLDNCRASFRNHIAGQLSIPNLELRRPTLEVALIAAAHRVCRSQIRALNRSRVWLKAPGTLLLRKCRTKLSHMNSKIFSLYYSHKSLVMFPPYQEQELILSLKNPIQPLGFQPLVSEKLMTLWRLGCES